MTRSIRGALTRMVLAALGALAFATMSCRREGEQAPAATPSAPTEPGPAPVVVDPPPIPNQASAAPLPLAPTEAPSSASPPPEDTTLRDRAPLSDEQIAAVSSAANRAELDQAKLARQTAKDPEVRKLATLLVSEHEALEKSQAQVLAKLAKKPAPSPLADELSAEAASTLATLKKARGADFDGVFLDAQLHGHQKFLELLDGQLISSAKIVDLKTLLQNARDRAKSHVDLVQRLQAARSPKAPAPAAGK